MKETRITASPETLARDNDITRTAVYGLIAEGKIDSIKVGKRRLVIVDSYERFVREQLAAAGGAA